MNGLKSLIAGYIISTYKILNYRLLNLEQKEVVLEQLLILFVEEDTKLIQLCVII